MKRFSTSSIGIAQGTRMMFQDFADGGPMWTASGDREVRHAITFDQPFFNAPSVQISVALWDTDHQTNARGEILADLVTPAGFDLVFKTWGDTRIARLKVSWLAIGPVRDEDAWDVE